MGHGTLSMWPITVKLSSLWVNVPVIGTTCRVKLSGWLASLTPSRPAWISLKEAGSYVAACLLGYSGRNSTLGPQVFTYKDRIFVVEKVRNEYVVG